MLNLLAPIYTLTNLLIFFTMLLSAFIS